MIPSALLRVTSRKGELRPRFVDPADPGMLDRAVRVAGLVDAAVARGARMGELLEEIDETAVTDEDPALWRGLGHLAVARTEADSDPPLEPVELRWELFRAAATHSEPLSPDGGARAFVERFAALRGVEPGAVWESLYADLPAEAVLRSADVPEPTALLHRYNLALVQGVLSRAHELRIRLLRPSPPSMRRLLRWMKFHQLLHRATREGGDLSLVVDGPVSLFGGSTRYGRALAAFLPALVLHPEPWTLEARVEWTRSRAHRTLRLSRDDGLVSHLPDTGAWRPRAVEQLAARFADGAVKGWTATDGEVPLTVGRELWFPDFVARSEGREAVIVSLGPWRADRLRAALESLATRPANVVLLVSRKARLDAKAGGDAPEDPRIVWYADAVPTGAVRTALEAFAAPAS